MTRSLVATPSRRAVLRGLVAAGLGLGLGRPPAASAAARKRRGKKRDKPGKPNEYGCLNVGAACRNAGQCCSGICEGKRRRGHDPGICRVDYDLCTTGATRICGIVETTGLTCACALTTGNAASCGDFAEGAQCRECGTDEGCKVEFGQGAACVVVGARICQGRCADTGGTACAAACPDPAR